jgi:NhaP-type Na+/H+ or K+/H+ antiporter
VLLQLSSLPWRGAGGLLGNVPAVSVGADVSARLSKGVRSTALTFILTRAGLGVDLDMLRRHAAPCARLALMPSTAEACTAALLARGLLGMDWVWCVHTAPQVPHSFIQIHTR